MTLLFEPRAGLVEPPIDLMLRGARGVAPLEFAAMPDLVDAREVKVEDPVFVVDERAAQVAAMVDAAREEAGAAMRAVCEAECEARLCEERARVAQVCAEFAVDRQRYFGAAEGQVVKLALAMARRVLAREVEADAMHLTATVHAALARVQDGSRSTLRVNAFEAERWRDVLVATEGVAIVGDPKIAAGECLLETSVGRVELGVRPQMDELERGFDDLLHQQEA